MRLDRLEAVGFRGLVNESLSLKDLTVFSGGMGTGKTSKLLAILFALTGSSLSGLNLDDLIHVESEFMWVKIDGTHEAQPFSLERRKRRGQPTSTKTDLPASPGLSEKVYIEGREISKLFIGAPTEKTLKIDALLGLSIYDQITSEITAAPAERRIEALTALKSSTQQYQVILERTAQVEEEIRKIGERVSQIDRQITSDETLHVWAEETERKADDGERRLGELQSKKSLLAGYGAQLAAIPNPPQGLDEEMKELEARYGAMQKRVAFLEAAMQILDLEGKKADEMNLCPLCGALISPKALEKIKHYDEEYKKYVGWVTDLEALLSEKRKIFEEARKNEERKEFLQGQVENLEDELSQIPVSIIPVDERERAEGVLALKNSLTQEKRELEIRRKSLEEQREAYRSAFTQAQMMTVSEIDRKIQSLNALGGRLKKIKTALMEAVDETRGEQLGNLRASFKEAFEKIYPYPRFTDVDFETVSIRGRDVLQVKAKTDGGWVYSHQMSTGENVAVSFALLSAINHLEKSPILLLDEPEEGLDEKGIDGLAGVLNNLKTSTQIMVATRSSQLAQLLQTPLEPVTQL